MDVMRPVLTIVQNLPVPFDRRGWLECQALVSVGHGVVVVCPNGRGDPSYQVIDSVELYKYRPRALGGSKVGFLREYASLLLATAWLAPEARRSGRFAVSQACNPPGIFWLIAIFFRAIDGTRFVFDHHDLCPEVYESRFPRVDIVVRAADIVVREFGRDDIDPRETRVSVGDVGVDVKPDDVYDYAGAIVKLMDDEPRRADPGKLGRARAEQEPAWNRQERAYLSVYQRPATGARALQRTRS